MIDPSFWRDEKVAECTLMERLMFIGLWNFAEDSGVGRASPKLIKADIFAYDPLRDSDIEQGLVKLASLGLIQLYEHESQRYYHVTNFKKHQTINRPSPSSLPLPNNPDSCHVSLTERSLSTHGTLPPNLKEVNLKEDKRKEREEKRKGSAEGKEKQKTHPPLPDNFQNLSPPLKAKLEEWLQYKLERRENYQPTGLKSLVTEILNNVKKYGDDRVMAVISESMSNGWKGIIWDRINKEGVMSGANPGSNYGPSAEPEVPYRQISKKL